LQELSEKLVEIHVSMAHLTLLNNDEQRRLWMPTQKSTLLDSVNACYRQWHQAQ